MYIPHAINENTITVIIDGSPKPIPSSHPNFIKIKGALISGEHEKVENMINVRESIIRMSNGSISIMGDDVRYQGRLVPTYQSEKLISMYRDGASNIKPFENFISRLMSNPSSSAREEFARFADYKELPFDEDGFVYAYKGVNEDLWSISGNKETRVISGSVDGSGRILNAIGSVIEVERSDVDDNCNRHCSHGLHAGSFDYAKGFGVRTLLVKIDPKDIVSVPTDCDGQKVRVCKYTVVSEYIHDDDIKDSILTEKDFFPDTDEDNDCKIDQYDEQYSYFCELIETYNINPRNKADRELIEYYMKEANLYCKENLDELFLNFEIADRINKYVNKKGGEATLKQIQSALKSYKLKQDEIQAIIEDFGQLT